MLKHGHYKMISMDATFATNENKGIMSDKLALTLIIVSKYRIHVHCNNRLPPNVVLVGHCSFLNTHS